MSGKVKRFIRKHWRCVLFFMAILAGCGNAPTVNAFDREYDWSKPAGRTAGLGIQVTFPSWLAACDRPSVLETVESYARGIIAKYPKAGSFWWGDLRVYLHEAVSEKIVCYYPAIWCWGWQLGQRVYTPWRPLFDADKRVVGVYPDDTFMVVPHEVFHLIGGWEVGARSVGDKWIEDNLLAREAIAFARANATRLELSKESVDGALAKLPYVPWLEPGR